MDKFSKWLLKQVDRDDPIGDLACDYRDDKKRIKEKVSMTEAYLRRRVASAIVEFFWEAVGLYEAETGEFHQVKVEVVASKAEWQCPECNDCNEDLQDRIQVCEACGKTVFVSGYEFDKDAWDE